MMTDQVDCCWLGVRLARAGVIDHRVHVTAVAERGGELGVAMTSQVARLAVSYDPAGAGPATVFVKREAEGNWASYHETELRFYRELADRIPVRVPRAIALPDDDEPYFLVLEDVIADGATHALDGMSARQGERVFEDLSRLHATFWGGVGLDEWPRVGWTGSRGARIQTRVRDTLDAVITAGRWPVSAEDARALRALLGAFDDWSAHIACTPETLVHGDGHIENLMFIGDEPVWLDWQTARVAHPARDLAACLAMNLATEDVAAEGERLIARYLAGLADRGIAAEPEPMRLATLAMVAVHCLGHVPFVADLGPLSARDEGIFVGEWVRLGRAARWVANMLV